MSNENENHLYTVKMATKEKSEPNIKCKVVVIGDLGVGKTSVVDSFVNGEEEETGVSKPCQLSKSVKDTRPRTGFASEITSYVVRGTKTIRLHIWDTAGKIKVCLYPCPSVSPCVRP